LALNIPDRYRDGLVVIARLDGDAFSEFYEALKQVPTETPTQEEAADVVAAQVKRVGVEDVRKIVDVLTSLYQVRSRSAVPAEKLASDIYDALQTDNKNLIPKADAHDYKTRLANLLSLDSLNIVATRAKELQMDVERAFCDARILTDLRPVFGKEVDTPKAMVIVHTLKLGYHDAATGKHEELFVALDREDIQKLKGILERAERKAKSLISRLQVAGIKAIEPS